MKKAIVIGSGDLFQKPQIEEKAYIVAVDGGYKYIKQYRIKTDLVLGDFDSEDKKRVICKNIITLPVHKDDTDTSYAINYLIEKGYDEFELYGMLGGNRFEHSLANIQVLAKIGKLCLNGKIYSPDLSYYLQIISGPRNIEIKRKSGTPFSLFAYTEKVQGLSIKGAEYNLEHHDLSNLNPLGISNTFVENIVNISIEAGLLLMVIYK